MLRDIIFGSDSGFRNSDFYRGENGGGDVEGEGKSLIVAEKIPDTAHNELNGGSNGDGDAEQDDGTIDCEV